MVERAWGLGTPLTLDPAAVVTPTQVRPPRPAGWDLLLGCVALYVATAVGRAFF